MEETRCMGRDPPGYVRQQKQRQITCSWIVRVLEQRICTMNMMSCNLVKYWGKQA